MDEGKTYRSDGRHAEAANAFERAVRYAEVSWGLEAPELIRPLIFLAMVVGDPNAGGHSRIPELLELEQRALRIVDIRFGEEDARIYGILEKTGLTLWQLGEHEKARERLERAVGILTKVHGDVTKTAYFLGMLADLLLDMQRPADALPFWERALRIQDAYGAQTVGSMSAAIGLGRCLRGVARMEEAAICFERALAIRIARRPPEFKGEDFVSKELREWIAEARAKP
jgi:tetratricopeptide (TPR) repeat protein